MSAVLSLSSPGVFEKYASKFSIGFIKPRQSREKRDLGIERAKERDKVERYLKKQVQQTKRLRVVEGGVGGIVCEILSITCHV